ncbi:MAG: amidohydrolase family protein, partial [Verrucomicrobiota bacterium]
CRISVTQQDPVIRRRPRNEPTAFMSMETVHHTRDAFAAVQQSGMMGVICHCLMDETGGYEPLARPIDQALETCEELRAEWADHKRLRIGVAPRFALSCSAENMKIAADYARQHGFLLHTHSSEQIEEVDLVKEMTGLYNIEFLHSVGLSGPDVSLAHCVHTQPHERELMKETDTKVLHCPSANLKLGSGTAPVPEYLEQGITVSIGADGAPCNNRLYMFLEMREAALIQKPRLGTDALSARAVVRMATEGGAETLNGQQEMGTLEPGKLANLIFIDPRSFHVVPSEDPATNVVYSFQGADVALTMVQGEILFEDGRLTTIDEELLFEQVRQERKALVERAGVG